MRRLVGSVTTDSMARLLAIPEPVLRPGAGGFVGRSAQAAGGLVGFGEGDGAWHGYESDCDQMFGGGNRDDRGHYRQLRPRNDMLGHGDLRGMRVGHLVFADVAVHYRQQDAAEYEEDQEFTWVLHGSAPGACTSSRGVRRSLFGEAPGWFS